MYVATQSNRITKVTGLNHLHELRVLNLAGNQIRVVEGVSGLRALTELNLRRNRLERVSELDELPALQRLFLSNNNITSFANVSCVFKVRLLYVCVGGPVLLADRETRGCSFRIAQLLTGGCDPCDDSLRWFVSTITDAQPCGVGD